MDAIANRIVDLCLPFWPESDVSKAKKLYHKMEFQNFTLDGDDGENVDGFFNGEVTLMLLNLCCTGVKLAVALALTGDGFAGTGSSSSLISTATINLTTVHCNAKMLSS